ncbi:acetylcholinesterase-1-like [Haemaphysalis longicornis]
MQLLDAYGVLDAGRLLEHYASHGQWDNHTVTVGLAKRVLGDVLYTCPVLYLAEHVSSSRNNSVHSYVFDHKPSFSVWPDPVAAQYEDLDFVFGVPLRQGLGTPEEQGLSRRLIQLVAGFAKNGALPELSDGAPWPQFSGLDNETVHITLGGYTLSPESRGDHCSRIRPHIFY